MGDTDIIDALLERCRFSEDDIDLATSGLCATFALSLYRDLLKRGIETDLVLICLADKDGKPACGQKSGNIFWKHVAVRHNDNYYDIYGNEKLTDMISNYCWDNPRGSGGVPVQVTFKHLTKIMRDHKPAYDRQYRLNWKARLAGVDLSDLMQPVFFAR